MRTVMELYQMGGWPMHLILFVALAGFALSVILPIVAYASGRPRQALVLAGLLAAIGVGAVLLGILGQSIGLAATRQAVVAVDPSMRPLLLAMGAAESRACLLFGLGAAAIPCMAAAITLGRAVSARVVPLAVWGGVALALGIGILVAGEVARQHTLIQVGQMAQLEPGQRAMMGAFITAEARARRVRGLAGGAPLAAIGIALVLVGARDRPE
jgi:hypothetical protein